MELTPLSEHGRRQAFGANLLVPFGLGISPRTVDNHMRHIFQKVDVSPRTALATLRRYLRESSGPPAKSGPPAWSDMEPWPGGTAAAEAAKLEAPLVGR